MVILSLEFSLDLRQFYNKKQTNDYKKPNLRVFILWVEPHFIKEKKTERI